MQLALYSNHGDRKRVLRKIISIHVEDDGDVFGEGGFVENGLDVVGQGAGFGGAEGDLEAELVVGADERAGQDFSERDAVGEVFLEADVEGLECEFGAAFVGGAGG
jgi:hypothetical protein